MRHAAALLYSLLFAAPLASAEIFKCTSKDGELKLQNFACALDTVGSTAMASGTSSSIDGSNAGILNNGILRGTAAQPHTMRNMVPNGSEPNGEEPYRGMSMAEVKASWGDPKSTAVVNGFEVWYYDGSGDTTRGVRFDRMGRVVAMDDEYLQ